MHDNGLLKYYRDKLASQNGYLNLDQLDFKKDAVSSLKAKIDNQDYYVKKCTPSVLNAEVLLSQVYKNAGLKSSICLPAIYQDEMFVVSKDVREQDCITGLEFFSQIKKENPTTWFADRNGFMQERFSQIDYSQYYTPQSIREMILMQAIDTGVYNTDRHMKNFYVQIDDTSSKMKAEHIVSFDYGVSGKMAEVAAKRPYFPKFYNSFGCEPMQNICSNESRTRVGMINAFKYHDVVSEYYPSEQLAEKLSNIDVRSVADDISEQTGFELHKHYVDIVADSVNRLAEEIGQ